MHRFTQEDLFQYLYKETSREKTAAIEEALVADWNLREQFDTLCSAPAETRTNQAFAASTDHRSHLELC